MADSPHDTSARPAAAEHARAILTARLRQASEDKIQAALAEWSARHRAAATAPQPPTEPADDTEPPTPPE